MPVLQLKKLSLGKIGQVAQGHTNSKWQRTKTLVYLNLEPIHLIGILYNLQKGKWGASISYPKQKVTWWINSRFYVWFYIKAEINLSIKGRIRGEKDTNLNVKEFIRHKLRWGAFLMSVIVS